MLYTGRRKIHKSQQFPGCKEVYIHIPQDYEKPLKITKNAGNGATIEDQFKFDRQSKTTFTYLHILGNLFAKLICNGEQKLKSANIGRPPCSFRYVMIMSEPFRLSNSSSTNANMLPGKHKRIFQMSVGFRQKMQTIKISFLLFINIFLYKFALSFAFKIDRFVRLQVPFKEIKPKVSGQDKNYQTLIITLPSSL